MARRKKKRPAPKRGVKMQSGKGWRLIKNNHLVGCLLSTFNLGRDKRVAVFSVPK